MTAEMDLEAIHVTHFTNDRFVYGAIEHGQEYQDYVNATMAAGACLIDLAAQYEKTALCFISPTAEDDDIPALPIKLEPRAFVPVAVEHQSPTLVTGPFVELPIERALLGRIHDIATGHSVDAAQVAVDFLRWREVIAGARVHERTVQLYLAKPGARREFRMLSSVGINL